MKRYCVVLWAFLSVLLVYPIAMDQPKKLIVDRGHTDFAFCFLDIKSEDNYQCIKYRLLPDEQEWTVDSTGYTISFEHLAQGDYRLQVLPVFKDGTEGEISNIEVRVLPCWYQTYWAFAAFLLLIGLVAFMVWMYFSKRKRQHKKNTTDEKGLKDELLQSQQERMREKNENYSRTQMFILVAHELRTPLSLIVAPLRELLCSSMLPAHFHSRINIAYRNSLDMQDTCDQLLSLYREGNNSGELDVSEYNLLKLTDNIVKSLNELMVSNGVDFQYKKSDKAISAWIDKQKIEFVIRNLLSNAFRHIAYSGSVSLEVQEAVEDGVPCCVVKVWDNGRETVEEQPGDFLHTISDQNEIVDFSKMELGYMLLVNVIRLHQGKIWFNSQKGEGTLIRFSLPLGNGHLKDKSSIHFVKAAEIADDTVNAQKLPDEKTLKLPTLDAAASVGNKKKILVVEDNRDIRMYLKVLFASEYTVVQAENGQEGVEMALKEEPDLVLSDVIMPVMDGFECCRLIKENLKTCHIPIIMLTARIEDEDIIKGIELGADDYLLKPFNPEVLRAKVRNLIRNRANLRQTYMKLLMVSVENPDKEKDPVESIEDKMMAMILKIVDENIEETDFSVKKLAEKMNMSQPTLYRKVKQSTGFTIVELIRGARLKRAAILLKEHTYTVQEVVERVGYNDAPTFRKHFVDFFGVTPSSYGSAQETAT